jgi:cyanophycinase
MAKTASRPNGAGKKKAAGGTKESRPTKGSPAKRTGLARGTLIIIGGREDKKGEMLVLREVARRVGSGKLVVATLASDVAGELWEEYKKVFRRLGVKHMAHLQIETREQVLQEPRLDVVEGADVIFFTGGAQIKITTQLGGTLLCERIQELYENGGTIAGTSAGASVMSETMLVSGNSDETHKVGASLLMAPGLGLLKDVIIDQHFAERGRMGRLLGAVAQNPRLLGLGIDEDTSIVVERARRFRVVGSGAVYVADGFGVTFTNLADEATDRAMSVFDVKLHVLSQGDTFDLESRRPAAHPAEKVEKEAAS